MVLSHVQCQIVLTKRQWVKALALSLAQYQAVTPMSRRAMALSVTQMALSVVPMALSLVPKWH